MHLFIIWPLESSLAGEFPTKLGSRTDAWLSLVPVVTHSSCALLESYTARAWSCCFPTRSCGLLSYRALGVGCKSVHKAWKKSSNKVLEGFWQPSQARWLAPVELA